MQLTPRTIVNPRVNTKELNRGIIRMIKFELEQKERTKHLLRRAWFK